MRNHIRYIDFISRDLLNRVHQHCYARVPGTSLTGILVESLDQGMPMYDVNQAPLEPLPIPSEMRSFFDQQQSREGPYDPVWDAYDLVERLNETQPTNDHCLSTHQYVRLLNCVYIFGKVKKQLIVDQPTGTSHWPSFMGALKRVWSLLLQKTPCGPC